MNDRQSVFIQYHGRYCLQYVVDNGEHGVEINGYWSV